MENRLELEEHENDQKPYESIVVMPYSSAEYRGESKSKIDPKFGLTFESTIATLAGIEAYRQGQADTIILMGEDTFGCITHSTVDFMKELLIKEGVPASAIVSFGHLNTSFEQIAKLSEAQRAQGKFLIISLGFHTPRVAMIAKRQKVMADHKSAETLLAQTDPGYAKAIKIWDQSSDMKKVRLIESGLRLVSRLDINGSFQKWLSAKIGPRKPLTDFTFQQRIDNEQLPPS